MRLAEGRNAAATFISHNANKFIYEKLFGKGKDNKKSKIIVNFIAIHRSQQDTDLGSVVYGKGEGFHVLN